MTIALNFKPSPVLATTPTMIPAAAQTAATLSTCSEPSLSAVINRRGTSADSRSRKLTAKVATVAQNTLATGEKPQTRKTRIATSEMKWNQYRRVNCHTDCSISTATAGMPNLRTSSSTITKSDR